MRSLLLNAFLVAFVFTAWSADRSVADDDAKIKENLGKLSEADRKIAEAQKICPIEEELLGSHGVPIKLTIKGQPVFICCKGCAEDAEKNADKTLKTVEELKKKNTKK